MKKTFFYLLSLSLGSLLNAQVSESCDCAVDTLGYSSFIQTLNPDENASFQFQVNGTFAVAYGVIDSSTPTQVQNLIDNYPNVTTIVMHSCPGSADDNANLQAAQLIYNAGYKMYLPLGGFIASGGTDMFLAGSTRVVDVTPDAVGVHSWSEDENGTVTATDYPVGHISHQPYIDYYMAIGFTQEEAEAFYYFTINSAPFTSVHWMTQLELDLYKVRTCKYSENPTYSVSITSDELKADLANKSYQWIDCSNNEEILNATNQTFTPSFNGSYAVIVSETECSDTSVCIEVSALSTIELNTELDIYTNPNNGILQMSIPDVLPCIEIGVYDSLGKLYNQYKYKNTSKVELNLPDKSGIYILHIKMDDKTIEYKAIRY